MKPDYGHLEGLLLFFSAMVGTGLYSQVIVIADGSMLGNDQADGWAIKSRISSVGSNEERCKWSWFFG